MLDFSAESSKLALEQLANPEVRDPLLRYAIRLTGSEDDGKDLLSLATAWLCDPTEGRPWNPARAPFLTHARMLVLDLFRRGRRSAHDRREVPASRGKSLATQASRDPQPDEALDDAGVRARLSHMGARLRGRLSGLPRLVFECHCRGEESAKAIAAELHCKVEAVYAANQAILREGRRVATEAKKEEALRMTALRRRATLHPPNEEEPQRPNEEAQQQPNEEAQQRPNEEAQQRPNEEAQQRPNEEAQQRPNEEEHPPRNEEEQP